MAVNSPTAMKGHRGQFFDLRLPDPADVYIEDVVHSLSNTCRFSGHTSPFFSVAQHSAECALLSLQMDFDQSGNPIDPEWEDRAYACLMHDAHEWAVGDVSSPMKVALGESFRLFEHPIHDATMTALAALDVMNRHKAHVKQVDLEMLYSDALRWDMDGTWITPNGDTIERPREWVPIDFTPHFTEHRALEPRYAAEFFWKVFFKLGGLERGANSYTDWSLAA